MGVFDIFGGIMKAIGANQAADAVNKSIDQGETANTGFASGQRTLGNTSFLNQRDQLQQGYGNALNRLNPYAQSGQQANNAYMQALLNPGSYAMSPAAQFQMQQGMGGLNNAAMARGGMTGNTLAAMNKFGQGLASQDYNQRLQQLMQGSQMGQNAANQLAGYDMSQGQNMSQNYGQQLGFDTSTNQNEFNNKLNFITSRGNNEASRANGIWGNMASGVTGTGNSLMSMFSGGMF